MKRETEAGGDTHAIMETTSLANKRKGNYLNQQAERVCDETIDHRWGKHQFHIPAPFDMLVVRNCLLPP